MDLEDQLKKLFPDHISKESEDDSSTDNQPDFWIQDEPLLCKYEKRKGKPITIIEGYNGAKEDFKKLEKILKTKFSVGGSIKNECIMLQGDYRDQIMDILKGFGFNVKRVGG